MGSDTHILLVDDLESQLHIMEKMVANLPYDISVQSARSGREAINYLDSTPQNKLPNLVITDYDMEDLTGLDLLKHIRKSEHYSSLPVVMVTVFDDINIRRKAQRLGVDDFLKRPVESFELESRCKALIFKSRIKGVLEQWMVNKKRNIQSTHESNEVLDTFAKAIKSNKKDKKALEDVEKAIQQLMLHYKMEQSAINHMLSLAPLVYAARNALPCQTEGVSRKSPRNRLFIEILENIKVISLTKPLSSKIYDVALAYHDALASGKDIKEYFESEIHLDLKLSDLFLSSLD